MNRHNFIKIVIVTFLLLAPVSSWATISLNGSPATCSSDSSAFSCSNSLALSLHDSVIVLIAWYSGSGASLSSVEVADNSANITCQQASGTVPGTTSHAICYLSDVTNAGTKTITVTMSLATFINAAMIAIQGCDNTACYEDKSFATTSNNGGQNVNCGPLSFTTANDHDAIFAICSSATAAWDATYYIAGGFDATITMTNQDTNTSGEYMLDKASAATFNAYMLGDGSTAADWKLSAAAFKVAGGAPAAPVKHRSSIL